MKYLILLLALLSTQVAFCQNQRIDSLKIIVRDHTQQDTVLVNTYNELSYQFQWIDFYQSLNYADQALKIAESLKFKKGIAIANYRKGHCYWALGDGDLAVEMGLDALEIAEEEHSPFLLSESYFALARAYMDQSSMSKSTLYINNAEKLSLQTKNWDQLSRIYNLAGVIEFKKSNRDSALFLYNKALSIINEHKVPTLQLAQVTSNIAECYIDKDPVLSLNSFTKALSIAQHSSNRSAEASISAILGRAMIEKGRFKEANEYLTASVKLARTLGLKRVIRNSYAGLTDLKIREGKSSEALGYMKSYYEVRDSLNNEAKTRQIVELESRHEIEQKEQAIKLLEKEKEIQRLWKNIFICTVISLAALSFLGYKLTKYRNRKNREVLNMEIDFLTRQHHDLSRQVKNSVVIDNGKTIESHDQRLLKRAIEIVENSISDPSFSVEKMSKDMGMSRTNMHRKIKAITGFPPSELIRSIRLRKAAFLLANQVDSVSQISLMVGFDDHSYFSKSFKKQFGVPPSEYLDSLGPNETSVRREDVILEKTS